EAEADRLDLLAVAHEADGPSVVRHDRVGARGDRGAEGQQMVLEAPSGVDLVAAVGEVGVLPVLLGSGAGEVLDGGLHRWLSVSSGETVEGGADELGGQLGVLREAFALARPARLGGEV